MSEASWTFCLENSTSASPESPADLPNTANDAAASIACFLLCPIDVAAVDAHDSICPADLPNRTPVLLTVSLRSDAAAIDLTANAPIAISVAPAATLSFLCSSVRSAVDLVTDFMPAEALTLNAFVSLAARRRSAW